jgi:hypothetical protein
MLTVKKIRYTGRMVLVRSVLTAPVAPVDWFAGHHMRLPHRMFDRQTFNRDELGCFLKDVWQATYRWSYCDFRTTSQSSAPRSAEVQV